MNNNTKISSAAVAAESPSRRHQHGLSPRQRRLLQASARARANVVKAKKKDDDETTYNTAIDNNNDRDGGTSSPNSSFIPSSPTAAEQHQAQPTNGSSPSPSRTMITPTDERKVPLSPIQHQSSSISTSPNNNLPNRPLHEFNTPQKSRGGSCLINTKIYGGGNSKHNNNKNKRSNSISGSGSGASTAVLTDATTASIENELQTLQLQPCSSSSDKSSNTNEVAKVVEEEGAVDVQLNPSIEIRNIATTTPTKSTTSKDNVNMRRQNNNSSSSSNENRLKMDSKWKATVNKYNHNIPPSNSTANVQRGQYDDRRGGLEEGCGSDINKNINEGESPTYKVVHGKVSDRIRAFSSNNGNTTDIIGGRMSTNDNLSHVQSISKNNQTNTKLKDTYIGECSEDEVSKQRGPLHEEEDTKETYLPNVVKQHEKISSVIKVQKANSPHTIQSKFQQQHLQKSQQYDQNQHKYSFTQQRYPSDENIGSDDELRYYRIAFRGVVSLISNLDDLQQHQQHSIQQSIVKNVKSDEKNVASPQKEDFDNIRSISSNNKNQNSSRSRVTYYVGYGEIVATSSPEIIIPLRVNNSNDDISAKKSSEKQMFVRAIRVDSIITGGYATDSTFAGQSSTTDVPNETSAMSAPQNENSIHGSWLKVDENTNNSQNQHDQEGPYGYLLLTDSQQSTIANPLPSSITNSILQSTTRCQHGSFAYRVTSTSPVSILSGPALDASSLGMGLLPDTVHDVSFRITIPLSPPGDEDDNDRLGSAGIDDTLIDDADPAGEVQFLRLCTRRGWVTDRRVDVVDEHKLRVSYLMQDVTTNEVEQQRYNDRARSGGGPKRRVDASISMSFEDNSSLNSSAMNSTANSSFYSSVVASSVATPTSIKTRRRRNRRHGGPMEQSRILPLKSTALPSSVVREHHQCAGESFEEVGSSITGGGTDTASISIEGGDSSSLLPTQQQATKTYYLMRVIAPMGLKILDAPHFQVSNLIHSPSPHKLSHYNNPRHSPSSPGISPFARTNAMISGSNSAENSPTQSIAGRKRNSPRVRFLARGQIFEASSRVEHSGDSSLYTNGQGLIKLADGSGWAIVPHQQDLLMQMKDYQKNNADAPIPFENINDIVAYEEIGNASIPLVHQPSMHSQQRLTPPKQQQIQENALDRSLKDIVWLRIASPPNGIKVLLPPSQEKQKQQQSTKEYRGGTTNHVKVNLSASHDSEVASSVSNSFFDSVWSRVTPTKDKEKDYHTGGLSRKTLRHQQQQPMIPVIPCGMVIPVESWDTSATSKKSFSRLYNGQGWIPRRLGEVKYAYEVDAPEIRVGSFWFRVKSPSGLDVKHGPSQDAPAIKTENDISFRFDCGEYLRVSEILTVFNKRIPGESEDRFDGGAPECFAKLYRRHNLLNNENDTSQKLLDRYSSLSSLTTPGEWVQVHTGDGKIFLEECLAAPTIERNRDGWHYNLICNNGLNVRCGPSFQANIVDELTYNQSIIVTEKVTANGEQSTWLRLRTGGWVCSIDNETGQAVVQEAGSVLSNEGRLYNDDDKNNNSARSQRMVRKILSNGSRGARGDI